MIWLALWATVAAFGCGGADDVPAGAVAEVGGVVITKSAYQRRLKAAAHNQREGDQIIPYDPPRFTKCVAAKRSVAKGAKDKPVPSMNALRARCDRGYERLRRDVLASMIEGEWIERDAQRLHLAMSAAQARALFERQRDQAFPRAGQYAQALKVMGLKERDVIEQVRQEQLRRRLERGAVDGIEPVTPEQVATYYTEHKAEYRLPERVNMRLIETESKNRALFVKRALENGQSWRMLAKRHSTDPLTADKAGRVRNYGKSGFFRTFEEAAFAAKEGVISGPIKTSVGWYVFVVEAKLAPKQLSLVESKDDIRKSMEANRESKAIANVIPRLRERYRGETTCADALVIAQCDNGPDEASAPRATASAL